jgi:hypothetical protein
LEPDDELEVASLVELQALTIREMQINKIRTRLVFLENFTFDPPDI